MNEFLVDLLSRWLHVLSGIALAGGLSFLCLVWWPANRTEAGAESSFQGLRGRWSRIVAVCTLILLVTGLWNGVRNIQRFDYAAGGYHAFVGIKLLLGLVVFVLAALLAGRTGLAQKMRRQLGGWLVVTTLLAVLVVMLGGYMKSMQRTRKSASPTAQYHVLSQFLS